MFLLWIFNFISINTVLNIRSWNIYNIWLLTRMIILKPISEKEQNMDIFPYFKLLYFEAEPFLPNQLGPVWNLQISSVNQQLSVVGRLLSLSKWSSYFHILHQIGFSVWKNRRSGNSSYSQEFWTLDTTIIFYNDIISKIVTVR